jgi:hypothetical protein
MALKLFRKGSPIALHFVALRPNWISIQQNNSLKTAVAATAINLGPRLQYKSLMAAGRTFTELRDRFPLFQ